LNLNTVVPEIKPWLHVISHNIKDHDAPNPTISSGHSWNKIWLLFRVLSVPANSLVTKRLGTALQNKGFYSKENANDVMSKAACKSQQTW